MSRVAWRLSRWARGLAVVLAACSSSGADTDLAQRCPALLEDPGLPATPEAAGSARSAGAAWGDRAIREIYLCRLRRIGTDDAAAQAAGVGAEARARRAYEARRQARATARSMMADRAEVAALEARDREKYGDPDGPSWEWLVARAQGKGLSGDAVFLSIIESAQRSNEAVDKSLGL